MTYLTAKFKVATSNGLGGDTFTRNVTDGRTHGRTDGRMDGRRTDFDTKLIYPFFLKKKAGIKINIFNVKFTNMQFTQKNRKPFLFFWGGGDYLNISCSILARFWKTNITSRGHEQ